MKMLATPTTGCMSVSDYRQFCSDAARKLGVTYNSGKAYVVVDDDGIDIDGHHYVALALSTEHVPNANGWCDAYGVEEVLSVPDLSRQSLSGRVHYNVYTGETHESLMCLCYKGHRAGADVYIGFSPM